jgi:hypothetical protein
MPFVRIDLLRGKSIQYRKTVGEIVYDAMPRRYRRAGER